ncbi:hypothetical protein TSUD_302550 [Trifolium subterraneum]|uniref:WRKY domain-containing protein n=1 Tax=Trifolium subterraneum TaxID=3900 RepID=A0A2Z6NCU4_TRISU|nr:hypothetical protein TSUD_302550 [Trifolium subterraneum]
MDNYQGDLTDIIRVHGTTTATATTSAGAYSTTGTSSSSSEHVLQHLHDNQWQHHNHNHNNQFFSSDHHHHQHQQQHQQPMSFANSILEGTNMNNTMFGDPLFSSLRDPFLQELDHIPSSSYFNITTNTTATAATTTASASPVSTSIIDVSNVSTSIFALDHNNHEIRSNSRPCKNIFSNMIQISPNPKLPINYESSSTMAPSPRPIKQVVSNNININANISKDSLLDNTGVQISSSRNSSGIKRRKNQAKKVVCIPAPAAANSRQTGEVVPSDLWAWRKYGQKPIKGSPYPRGYYRCSSSKGCSARKQVERSRTDPNMLVITYTSEHNHPWPTQRNALAGSTRSQPSKNMKNSETSLTQNDTTKPKEEHQENNNNSDGNDSPIVNNVKEENMEDIEKLQIEMDEVEGEIEADPLNLLFNQGFSGNSSTNDVHQRDQSKGLDPFHLFDWSVDNNNTNK